LKRIRKLALGAASLVLCFAATEIGLRIALFSDVAWIREHAWRLRRAELFFDPSSDDDYWKLRREFGGSTGESPARLLNSELGWVDASIDPATLSNARAPAPGDTRRVVLLYGCSFSRCMTPSAECFEGLLEQSPLGRRYVLVNYGVGGYGLDQTSLMLDATLPRFAAAKPIVIVGILLDDDFDRCVLRLRGSPKPRFVLRRGALERESERVPALDEFLRVHPLGPTSYAWRCLARAYGWARDQGIQAEKRQLGAALLASITEKLRAEGVESFFVLYSGEATLSTPPGASWREAMAIDELRKSGAHFVATRASLERFAREHGGSAADCFLHEGDAGGHYSALGNQVVFSAMLAGLEGRFD
jgi:hypothetical protein